MYTYPVGSTRYDRAVTEFKRNLLKKTLEEHGGNRTRAAQALGLQRTYIQRLIKQLHVRPESE